MKLPRRQFLHLAAGAAALPAASRIAGAQAYPSRPVRLIAPFAPGGATDLVARLMGQWLSERFGQQFIVENRPGAGGNIGTETVVRAPSDGYTLLVAGLNDAVNATLYTSSSSFFCATLRRSQVSSAFPSSWSCHPHFRRRRFPSLLLIPNPMRSKSTWPPLAMDRPITWPANCSR